MPAKRKKAVKEKRIEPKPKMKEKVAEILELPKEVVLNIPKITMVGNGNLLLENYKGIIEYADGKVRINTGTGVITLTGEFLVIKEITSENIYIDGKIHTVEFAE